MSQISPDLFVTVVSVGIEGKTQTCTPKKAVNNSEYITVLTIGNEETKTIKDVCEEVIIYRLPGERLGFGLKFEGGTKAHEFVKRLFIQSCAPDSPASRVQSSWGQLVEGDEVLEIDSVPVNSMTRIDCVRFLKDSNVAIKLLVKHCFNTQYAKSSEDLPVIVSTEEKKPPPVPPRKLHRKLHKNLANFSENVHDNIVPTIKQLESFTSKSTRLQSPRNSFRKKYSPDVSRRLSDGSLGPPDAEVYIDLISQESTQSLSESDDTGSTISTVLDRFASFPTTTTSSFAGSLPSTPTSIQKHLDLTYIIDDFPDDDLLPVIDKKFNRIEENNNILDGTDEMTFKYFQDVTVKDETDFFYPENNQSNFSCPETPKRPVIIPRSRDRINNHLSNDSSVTLPRLVDFVPKLLQKDLEASVDSVKRFLDSERFDFEYSEDDTGQENDVDYNMGNYGTKWILSSHLSTIGEDEEEQNSQESSNAFGASIFTPRVMIETSEFCNSEATTSDKSTILSTNTFDMDNSVPMEVPPTDSRQPPDGHEFPNFIETTPLASENNYRAEPDQCVTNISAWNQPINKPLDRSISSSNYDLRPKMDDSDEEKYEPAEKSNLLHTRSQSLIDMSIFLKEKSSSKWNTLMEQRKSRLSKLKGLVIPEAAENDVIPLVNIPEIKSVTTSQMDLTVTENNTINEFSKPLSSPIPPMVLPSWSSNTSLPKYSPAFKRKSLQVYPVITARKSDSSDAESSFDEYISKYSDSTPSRTTDDPKSLESIASPTRSDCSFEYTSLKHSSLKDHPFHHTKDFADSDNDSAVSSSQSSYNSRSSPPPSPTSEDKLNSQNRMLKPSSVEAINRKNILASAKCRSGKDIKIGSPVVQRKSSLEEEKTEILQIQCATNDKEPICIISPEEKLVSSVTLRQINHIQTVSCKEVEPVISKERNDYRSMTNGEDNSIANGNEATALKEEISSVNSAIIVGQIEEKPVPSKRTLHSAPPKECKSQNEMKPTENGITSLLQRHSASSILDKRNKPVNVRSLKANFENATLQSLPVFPKSYKAGDKSSPGITPPELANGKPIVTTRRRSEDFHLNLRQKSDDKLLFRQISHDDKLIGERRRFSSSSVARSNTSSCSRSKEELPASVNTGSKLENIEKISDKKSNLTSPNTELKTVELNLDQANGILGITLAGGVDYENKNITIHRIRYGSIAYQDGELKKGDKVISINGHETVGLTHSAATDLLKASAAKCVIVIEEIKSFVSSSNLSRRISSSVSSLSSETKGHENDTLSSVSSNKKPTQTVKVIKDGGGLGFSIEGGKDSPKGDVPLVVKKIFAGGAADKSGELKVGDEILSVNKINFQIMSRIEAWSQMKKIPEGEVLIEIFR